MVNKGRKHKIVFSNFLSIGLFAAVLAGAGAIVNGFSEELFWRLFCHHVNFSRFLELKMTIHISMNRFGKYATLPVFMLVWEYIECGILAAVSLIVSCSSPMVMPPPGPLPPQQGFLQTGNCAV